MQLEANYNQGKLKFKKNIRFTRNSFPVIVTVPESEIVRHPGKETQVISDTPAESAIGLVNRIKQILGSYYCPRPAATVAEDKAAYHKELDEKYI